MDRVGVACAFLSAILMATIGVFSRYTGLPPEVITFFRLFLGAVFMALFLFATGKLSLVWKWPTFSVLFSGTFLAGFILLYIEAMNYTTMANAIMLVYLAPFVASIGAHLFLGERLSVSGLLCIVAALFGFIMMMEFHFELQKSSSEYRGLLCSFGALLLYAGYILINRMVDEGVHVYTRTFWQLLAGACVVAPWLEISFVSSIATSKVYWLLAIGFFPGFLAILCAVIALRRLSAALFGTIAYTEAVAVVIFGWVFFQEHLSLLQSIGCLLILLSGSIRVLFVKRNVEN